jgi:beta-lactamase regulating signal transducer with metallopeptidase domain
VHATRGPAAAAPPPGAPRQEATPPPAIPWPAVTLATWGLVAFLLTGRLALSGLRLVTRLRRRWTLDQGAVTALFGRLLGRCGRRRPVRLTASGRLPVPIAWGIVRPEVSLPARVVRELSPYHQESILAHELAHVLRQDPAWLAGARLLECLLFFQPLNRLARRRLQELAELRCDDRAVELTGRPVELARCLTEVATWRLAAVAALPVPSMSAGTALARRIQRLLSGEARGERLPRGVAAAGAIGLVALALLVPGVRAAVQPDPAAAPASVGGDPSPEPPPPAVEEGGGDPNHGWEIVGERGDDGGSVAAWEGHSTARELRHEARLAARTAQRRARAEALAHHREHAEAAAAAHQGALARVEQRCRQAGLRASEERLHQRPAAGPADRDRLRREALVRCRQRRAALEDLRTRGLAVESRNEVSRQVERALREVERTHRQILLDLDLDPVEIEAEVAAEVAAEVERAERERAQVDEEIARAMAAAAEEVRRELAGLDGRVAAELARERAEGAAVRRDLVRITPRIAVEVAAEVAATVAAEVAAEGLSPAEAARIAEEVRRAVASSVERLERIQVDVERSLRELEDDGAVPEERLWRLERELERAEPPAEDSPPE